MINFKVVFVSFLLIFFCAETQAQRKIQQLDPEQEVNDSLQKQQETLDKIKGRKWYEDVSLGGNLGGYLGSGSAFVTLQPMAFYRFTENTMAGVGISYYYWSLDYYNSLNVKTTISDNAYGFNLFGRQQLFNPLFAQVEFMPLNFKVYNNNNNDVKREWVSSFYVGGGVNQKMSERSGYYILFLYDVLYNAQRSFRGSPIDIRTGFYF